MFCIERLLLETNLFLLFLHGANQMVSRIIILDLLPTKSQKRDLFTTLSVTMQSRSISGIWP